MSDSYIRSLTQKYRVAVAISVLKDKPRDVSIENYIEDLKSKINNDKIEDLGLTVCSDDFDMEESPTPIEIDTEINFMDRQTFNNNVIEIRDPSTRQEISKNYSMMKTNFIAESINITQYGKTSNSESTFCETQHSQNIVSCQKSHYDTFKSNEVPGPNEVQYNSNEVSELHHVSDEINRMNTFDHTYYDSQATELYSLRGFTQNYTHVSQSQNHDDIVISDKYLKAKNNVEHSNYNIDINSISDNFHSNANGIQFTQNDKNINSEHETLQINENNVISNKRNEMENQLSIEINESFPQYAQDNEVTENGETNVHKRNEEINENDDNSSNESQIVSFKVVEELNKIKNYINKKVDLRITNDGSVDSGYKSDSQSKCSFRSSLQLSGNWLNQSAYSLYVYITQCPLLATTHEIVGEIAQVLGQLIDRLHEEEKYPSFLDELLENVYLLLQDLFQGRGGEDVLLRKDENVQRLLLLNKSVHIQKYTIEKITTLLENILCFLTNPEETYEISNIIEVENICYIFHSLEVILKRYLKLKNMSSQEITNSQIEVKKSSITELWRKKWNPNYKEDNIIEEFTPKKCVLIKCNEVLNKLVVTCMDKYSLVAFAALNCFNTLQS